MAACRHHSSLDWGTLCSYDYGFRVQDARLGRFLSVDPVGRKYPFFSPYHFAGNNPIRFLDIDGLEPVGGPGTWTFLEILYDPQQGTAVYSIEDHQGGKYTVIAVPHPQNQFADVWFWASDAEFEGLRLGTGGTFAYAYDELLAEKRARQVWINSANTMAKIFELEMTIALMGPEAVAEGILEKGAELVVRKAAIKYAPKASKWIAKGVEQAKDAYSRFGKKIRKYNPCGCFSGNTFVLTAIGSVPIENISIGDAIVAFDLEKGDTVLRRVIAVISHPVDSLINIFVDGELIRTTPDHRFWTGLRWTEAKYLKLSDKIFLVDGSSAGIDSIRMEYGKIQVYDLTIDEHHNYFVSKIAVLVHNNCFDQLWSKSTHRSGKNVRNAPKGTSALEEFDKMMKASGVDESEVIGDLGYSFTTGNTKIIVRKSKNGPMKGEGIDTIKKQVLNDRGEWKSKQELRFEKE